MTNALTSIAFARDVGDGWARLVRAAGAPVYERLGFEIVDRGTGWIVDDG